MEELGTSHKIKPLLTNSYLFLAALYSLINGNRCQTQR